MKLYSLVLLSGSLGVLAAVVGCADGGASMFKRDSVVKHHEPVKHNSPSQHNSSSQFDLAFNDSHAVDQTTFNEPSTKLVSVASTQRPLSPSLVTLPAGSDLSAAVADAPGTVVLDFYADWCGPCRSQAKILQELESTAAEMQALIVKVNVDDHPELAEQMQVSALPTLIVVKNGELVHRQTGLASKQKLIAWMQ